MGFSVASLLIWVWEFASCEKRQRGRWRPGWGHQEGPGRDILFLLAKMSQDLVDDVLLLNATVRRIDDDFDSPPQRLQTSMSILNTRLSRWAQVIPDKAGHL